MHDSNTSTPPPRSRRSERGASLVEYALLVALVAAVCVFIIDQFGGEANSLFSEAGESVNQAS